MSTTETAGSAFDDDLHTGAALLAAASCEIHPRLSPETTAGLPPIDSLRHITADRILQYIETIRDETAGGTVGLQQSLVRFGFERAIYMDLIEHFHQLEYAATHQLPIWDARGHLKLPRIPKGQGADKLSTTQSVAATRFLIEQQHIPVDMACTITGISTTLFEVYQQPPADTPSTGEAHSAPAAAEPSPLSATLHEIWAERQSNNTAEPLTPVTESPIRRDHPYTTPDNGALTAAEPRKKWFRRTPDEQREVLATVHRLREEQGLKLEAACRRVGIPVPTYQTYKRRHGMTADTADGVRKSAIPGENTQPESLTSSHQETMPQDHLHLIVTAIKLLQQCGMQLKEACPLFGITNHQYNGYRGSTYDMPTDAAAIIRAIAYLADTLPSDVFGSLEARLKHICMVAESANHRDDDAEDDDCCTDQPINREECDFFPTESMPGTRDRIDVYEWRVRKDTPLYHPLDRKTYNEPMLVRTKDGYMRPGSNGHEKLESC